MYKGDVADKEVGGGGGGGGGQRFIHNNQCNNIIEGLEGGGGGGGGGVEPPNPRSATDLFYMILNLLSFNRVWIYHCLLYPDVSWCK